MKSIPILLALAISAFADKPAEEKRELLSSHKTTAVFSGITDHKCLGRTSLCPDRCGHSGKLANFKITEYLAYEKPGEYGDPKQEAFQILIEDNMGNAKVSPEILKAIKALKPGDAVHLSWNHDYVTKDGTSSPERTIQLLEKKREPWSSLRQNPSLPPITRKHESQTNCQHRHLIGLILRPCV